MTEFCNVFQMQPNSAWYPPLVLDPSGGRQIVVQKDAAQFWHAFYIRDSLEIYTTMQGQSMTFPLGVNALQMAAGQQGDGRIEVFFIDPDNNINHITETAPNSASWSSTSFGGQAKQIALCSNFDGRLELFYVGMDNYVYHNWQVETNSTTWDWARFDFQATKIAVIKGANRRLQLVITLRTTIPVEMNQIASCIQAEPGSSTWSPLINLQGIAKEINLVQCPDGHIELYYTFVDDSIRFIRQVGLTWQDYQVIGGTAQQLCLCTDADGRLELFYVGMDGFTYHLWQTVVNGNWDGGGGSAGFQASYLASTLQNNGLIYLFFTGFTQSPTANVDPPEFGPEGTLNYTLYNGGRFLYEPSVTLTVTEEFLIQENSSPSPGNPFVAGWSLQMNCFSQIGSTIQWQQYAFGLYLNEVVAIVNNWNQLAYRQTLRPLPGIKTFRRPLQTALSPLEPHLSSASLHETRGKYLRASMRLPTLKVQSWHLPVSIYRRQPDFRQEMRPQLLLSNLR